jgi:drug/metabolite transporter (DMT)-like permease
VTRYRNLGLFVVLAALWGSAFMAIKAGVSYFPPVLFAALRYDLAGLLMLGYAAYVLDAPVPRGREQWSVVAVGAVFLIAAYHTFLFVGETDPAVNSATAAVIVSLSPVLTTGFARAFLPSDRLTVVGVAGLLLGLVGVGVLTGADLGSAVSGGVVAKLFVLAAATAFAFGSVVTRRIDGDLPIESMEAWSMLGGAALMHLVSLGIGESPASAQWTEPRAVAALAFLAVGASAVGFLIYFRLLERLGPVEINLVSYVAPVFAALAGWVFLSETPTLGTAIGFCLIFCGFLLVKRDAVRSELPRVRRAALRVRGLLSR